MVQHAFIIHPATSTDHTNSVYIFVWNIKCLALRQPILLLLWNQKRTVYCGYCVVCMIPHIHRSVKIYNGIRRIQYMEWFRGTSWIGLVQYLRESGWMSVEMRGDTYEFCNVPGHVYDGFKAASSRGKFYHLHIEGKFDCR